VLKQKLNYKFIYFIWWGGINTLLTYTIYLCLNLILNYKLAYFLSYFIGILCSYHFNSNKVFKVGYSVKTFLFYPVLYLSQFGFSFLLLYVSINKLQINENIAPLLVIAFLFPITYLLNKLIFYSKEIKT